jgi:hypothetical protein
MLPERVILTLLNAGINAIEATPALLDPILSSVGAAELTKAKTLFASNRPTLVLGYPRAGASLPCYAVVLTSDEILQDYIGMGDEAYLDAVPAQLGSKFKRRVRGTFTVFVYGEHPDWTVWLYRVGRRILNMGARYLETQGLQDPVISGADLAPDLRYSPENTYVRRLTLTVEYEDGWDDTDGLWIALNGAIEPFAAFPARTTNIQHIDSPPGLVEPYLKPPE